MTPQGLIFDIDGTLADTNYLHTVAWRRAFLECGLDVPSAAIHRMVGADSDVLVRELAGGDRPDVKAEWRRQFDKLTPEIRPLPGAPDVLRDLAARGLVVALASSSEEDDIEALLDALDCRDAIAAVTSAGDVERAKPSPEVFEATLEKAGLEPGEAVVVGDTIWDVEAAEQAGMPCICVLTGGASRLDLLAAGAEIVYPDVTFLREYFADQN